MMPRVLRPPRVEDLYAAPELAALSAFEATADIAALAIAAAYPELENLGDPVDESDELRAALVIFEAAQSVVSAVNRYRLALELAKRRDLLLPF